MTTDCCDRTWQVEALEDGRLELEDRASFERHSQACTACSAERARLSELRRIMSEAPAAERTELERRRARIALLGAANQRVVERRASSRRIQTWALVAALPLLGLSALALAHVLHSNERWQRGGEVTSASKVTVPVAQPLRHNAPAPTEVADSPTGSAGAQVNPAPTLSAGTPRPKPAHVVPPASAALPPAGVTATVVVAPAHDSGEPTGAVGRIARSAGARFAEAVAAFGAGDYGRADTLFGAFARDFSTDGRAEDASFLRADARARRGDKTGAAAAARAYLEAYPNGLRRPAAERLAEDR